MPGSEGVPLPSSDRRWRAVPLLVAAVWLPALVLLASAGWMVQAGWTVWCALCLALAWRMPAASAAVPVPAEPPRELDCLLQDLPMPACICSLPDGALRTVNPAMSQLAAEPAGALAGRAITEFCLVPQDRQRVEDILARGLGVDDIELPFKRRDGAVRWVSVSARPTQSGDSAALLVICHDITGHRQAQSSLAASEQRFRVLLGALSEAVVLYDANARVLTSNRSAESCVWLDAAHAGLPDCRAVYSLFDEQGRGLSPDMHPVLRSLGDGVPARDVVIGAEDASGQMRWLTVNTQPLFHSGARQPYALVASYSDLTARIRAERALRASEQRYALALRGMNEGLAEWITGSDRMYVSPRLSQIMGHDAGGRRMRVRDFVGGIHPGDRRAWWAMVASHLKGRTDHFQLELRMRHADGRYHWFQLRGVAQRDSSGRSNRVVGTMADVTVRKRLEVVDLAERELLSLIAAARPLPEVLDRLAGLVSRLLDEGVRCAVLGFDAESGRVVEAGGAELPCGLNRRLQEGADEAAVQLLDRLRACSAVMLADAQAAPESGLQSLLPDGAGALWALPLAARDGVVLGGLVMIHPHPWQPDRADEKVIERLVDIAQLALERARAERQVRELNESLERRVVERTAMLEQANSELEAFSYSVSHDLRSPLRAINGFAHLLAEHTGELLDAEGRDMLERIQRGASRMGLLIDDILHFSRVSRVDMAPAEIHLDPLIASVIEDLSEQYPATRVDLSPIGSACGDAAMLRQVFVNLIGNALKFSSHTAHARVEIFVDRRHSPPAICVRDNGVGFDMSYADRLFGVFQRMHGADEFPGTGVGLAIVKRIVERHGGEISVESAPGRGALFRFTLDRFRPAAGGRVASNEPAGDVPRTGT